MSHLRVGIVRGGIGCEYDVSLKTGSSVLKHLPEQYKKKDILITKDGTWHIGGVPFDQTKLKKHVDVVFNCLHGEFGEDGQIQKFLDTIGVPYTGSGHLGSALGMNKVLSKDIARKAGVKVPQFFSVKRGDSPADSAKLIFMKFAPPYVVKPADKGSSAGLFFVQNAATLADALAQCLDYTDDVLVEEYIRGTEATCGVLENFRDQAIYAMLPIEIRCPAGKKVFDYSDKYSGETEEICPGRFHPDQKTELERLSAVIHRELGLRHYSRSDFIVSPKGIYYLETNTLPGLTPASLVPKSLAAAGIPYPHFLDHLVKLATNQHP